MSSNANKLHPIYVALDNHNWSKAVKLCLALPASNTVAQALLAHAYVKSGERYNSLITIESILGATGFPELQLEIKYSLDRRMDQQEAQLQQQPAPSASSSKKGGKKGKKKAMQASTPAASQTVTDDWKDWDLVDQLDSPPVLPDTWVELPPTTDKTKALTDPTLLSTLSMTLLSHLKLPLSNYQLCSWAASAADADEVAVRKAFCAGFPVLVAPQYERIIPLILANMQVFALQLSRMQQQLYGMAPAAAWAAQTALWQMQYKGNPDTVDAKQEQRLAMLPRLGESLASKCVQQEDKTPHEGLVSPEAFLLHLRTLDQQSKWEEMLSVLNERLPDLQDNERMSPSRQIMIDSKLQVLEKLKSYTAARVLLETELLKEYPDDWSYWKKHLYCSLGEASNEDCGLAETETLVIKVLSESQMSDQSYPLRGPHLMRVELAAVRLQRCKTPSEGNAALIECIIEYGIQFSARASCTFSDLSPYMDLVVDTCSTEDARSLVDRMSKFLVDPTSDDPKQRRQELRVYIYVVKMIYKVVSKVPDLTEMLPSWKDILTVWSQFRHFETKSGQDQEQKESRPGDDLILLVLQQLLQGEPSEAELGFSAVVIESALQHSPDNAYLKIAAMFLYSQLDAVSRSWNLFQELYIKHIQHESCAYLILPLLRAGGFYRETIIVCQEIIRLQTTNARDAGTFAGRAMENGTMSKADEFLSFQLTKLNRSLTTLEAKGLVLDCAPMFVNDERQRALGAMHGIVGEEFDLGRARCMVTEAHRPLAAFSLLQVKGSIGDSVEQFSDNRDFTILSHDLLNPRTFDSKEQIVSDSIRRGHHHNLLIRCVLIVDLTKGPKKGKVVAASSALKKRTASLLSSIAAARVYCEKSTHPLGYQELSQTMLSLCGVVTVLSVGRFSQEDSSLSSPDDLETREEKTCDFLKQALDSTTKARHQLDLTNDARVCRVGELLPDYLVPIIALLKMCTQLMELYGWGRRKRKTRRCAAAFSDLALLMVSLLGDMQTCIARLPLEGVSSSDEYSRIFPGFFEDTVLRDTSTLILQSQEITKTRIEVILNEILSFLTTFDVDA